MRAVDIEFAVVGIGLNLFEADEGYPLMHCRELPEPFMKVGKQLQALDRSRLAAEIVNALLEETKETKAYRTNIYSRIWCREGKSCIVRRTGVSAGQKHWKSVRTDGSKYRKTDGSVSILSYGEVSLII